MMILISKYAFQIFEPYTFIKTKNGKALGRKDCMYNATRRVDRLTKAFFICPVLKTEWQIHRSIIDERPPNWSGRKLLMCRF